MFEIFGAGCVETVLLLCDTFPKCEPASIMHMSMYSNFLWRNAVADCTGEGHSTGVAALLVNVINCRTSRSPRDPLLFCYHFGQVYTGCNTRGYQFKCCESVLMAWVEGHPTNVAAILLANALIIFYTPTFIVSHSRMKEWNNPALLSVSDKKPVTALAATNKVMKPEQSKPQ